MINLVKKARHGSKEGEASQNMDETTSDNSEYLFRPVYNENILNRACAKEA